MRNGKPHLCENNSERRVKFSYGRSFLSISGMVHKIILPLGTEKYCILLGKKINLGWVCQLWSLLLLNRKHDEMLIIAYCLAETC